MAVDQHEQIRYPGLESAGIGLFEQCNLFNRGDGIFFSRRISHKAHRVIDLRQIIRKLRVKVDRRESILQFAVHQFTHTNRLVMEPDCRRKNANFESVLLQSQTELNISQTMPGKSFIKATVLKNEWPPQHRISGGKVCKNTGPVC